MAALVLAAATAAAALASVWSVARRRWCMCLRPLAALAALESSSACLGPTSDRVGSTCWTAAGCCCGCGGGSCAGGGRPAFRLPPSFVGPTSSLVALVLVLAPPVALLSPAGPAASKGALTVRPRACPPAMRAPSSPPPPPRRWCDGAPLEVHAAPPDARCSNIGGAPPPQMGQWAWRH